MIKKLFVVIFVLSICLPAFADLQEKLTLDFRDTDVREIYKIIASKAGLGIAIEKSVRGNITINIKNSTAKEALNLVSDSVGFTWVKRGNNILITEEKRLGREIKVIPLKHISADEVAKILSCSITADIKIATCEHMNSIILNGGRKSIEDSMMIIGHIDRPARK